jgi:hypothetical protein
MRARGFSAIVAVLLILGTVGSPHAKRSEPTAIQDPGPDQYPAHDAISAFVRRIFQDQSGNLWFGTNGDGIVRYDGDSLEYFSINEGFGGVAVRGIVEDQEGKCLVRH